MKQSHASHTFLSKVTNCFAIITPQEYVSNQKPKPLEFQSTEFNGLPPPRTKPSSKCRLRHWRHLAGFGIRVFVDFAPGIHSA